MSSHNYDALRQTWIYQEIQQQIQAEEAKRQQEMDRQTLFAIVQARFPRLGSGLKEIIETHTHPDILRDLIIQIGSARTEKEVRQHLLRYRQSSPEYNHSQELIAFQNKIAK